MKLEGGGPVGPPVEEVNDLSHICTKLRKVNALYHKDLKLRMKIKRKTKPLRLTTRLPSSKVVVYLSVQKSRAAANVVGA